MGSSFACGREKCGCLRLLVGGTGWVVPLSWRAQVPGPAPQRGGGMALFSPGQAPRLIPADGNSLWNGAENVLIFLAFSSASPLMGAAGSVLTMDNVPWKMCQLHSFSHGILPLINPFDF